FFFSSRRRHTRSKRDWSSDVCSSDLSAPRSTPCGSNNLMKVAIAQFHSTVGAVRDNGRRILGRQRRAREQRAEVVLFPELCVAEIGRASGRDGGRRNGRLREERGER